MATVQIEASELLLKCAAKIQEIKDNRVECLEWHIAQLMKEEYRPFFTLPKRKRHPTREAAINHLKEPNFFGSQYYWITNDGHDTIIQLNKLERMANTYKGPITITEVEAEMLRRRK